MLKTNSKKAKENLIEYILKDFDYIEEREEYDGRTINKDGGEVCKAIYRIFCEETKQNAHLYRTEQRRFEDWASGLALGRMFEYYLCSAVDTLGAILEETEAEKSKYTESQAEAMLTSLIFRTVKEHATI